MKSVELSLVIPVFNESDNLPELVNRCIAVCESIHRPYEIVFVDDGSSDGSRQVLRDYSVSHAARIVVVLLNRNYGQHSAVIAGLAQACGEVVVTLDADLQNPPEEIPKLLAKIDEGCDVVGSYRQTRRDSWLRRLPSLVVNSVVRKTTGVQMRDYGCMLRAYRRYVVEAILACPERSTFVPILANSFASKTADVGVNHAPRSAGESKYSFWKLINLQFDLLTSITAFPLRLLSLCGGLMAILGFCAGTTIGIMRIANGPTWAADGVLTVIAVLFVFVGVQLLGMGLLGEYLGRVYNDVRGRPRYFIEQTIDHRTAADRMTEDQRIVPLKQKKEGIK